MQKILVVYTGGTLGMELKSGNLVAANLDLNLALSDKWLIDHKILITYLEQKPIDSANVELDFYLKLAKTLRKFSQDYAGIVVLHGTDTMEFSASMMAFLCSDLKLPIIFTGAQKPILFMDSDAKDNIQKSILWSLNSNLVGVYISFGDYLLHGINSYKHAAKSFDAFRNAVTGIKGKVERDAQTASQKFILYENSDSTNQAHTNLAKNEAKAFETLVNLEQRLDIFCNRINNLEEINLPHIVRIRFFPNIDEADLIKLCKDADLIFLEAYASGTTPDLPEFLAFLRDKIEQNVKVILLSQAIEDGIYQADYSSNLQARLSGIFSGQNMTFASAFAKSIFLWLAEVKDNRSWQDLWNTNLIGEF